MKSGSNSVSRAAGPAKLLPRVQGWQVAGPHPAAPRFWPAFNRLLTELPLRRSNAPLVSVSTVALAPRLDERTETLN
jgi:hypothetical protein